MAETGPDVRSRMMAAVGQRDTAPEMVVRRLAHGLGYRFRLHRRELPGTPDLVFPSKRSVVFVHGCFWHRHTCDVGQRPVRTRPDFWKAKFARNKTRDARDEEDLRRAGWRILTIWECETYDPRAVGKKLVAFLGKKGSAPKDHGRR